MEDTIHNMYYFLPTSHSKICLLDMDITEPELLIRRIAEEDAKAYPECFHSEAPCVFYRLRYTPPYENFRELKNLIIQIRQATGIRSEYHGLICIDPSEYKGHEDEEYFAVVLKYLFDSTENSTAILVCCQYTEQEMARLASVCMKCLKCFSVSKKQIHIFKEDLLYQLVKASFKEKKVPINSDSIQFIVDALQSPDLIAYRSLQLIDSIPYEIQRSGLDILAYFSNPTSSLCLMAGHPLITERGIEHDYTF